MACCENAQKIPEIFYRSHLCECVSERFKCLCNWDCSYAADTQRLFCRSFAYPMKSYGFPHVYTMVVNLPYGFIKVGIDYDK